jgi:hypothetical protein
MMGTMMQDLAFAIPGVDEAMSFAEIMKYVPFVSFLRKRGGGEPYSYDDLCDAIRGRGCTGTSSRWNTP